MKVVHNSLKDLRTAAELVNQAKVFEESEEWEDAAKAYQKVIHLNARNEFAYNRLMMIYRKLKEYKKELQVINKGIREFSAMHDSARKIKAVPTVAKLSKAISKATGLLDEKGKALYAPEPIGKWQRRKSIVEKKIQ